MPLPDELIKILEEKDLEVTKKRGAIRATSMTLPVSLLIKYKNKNVWIEIEPGEELSDVLVDLIESGEDIKDMVEDVLSELRDIAIEVSRFLEEKGYSVELRLREGENDVRDALEDIVEEYEELEEE